MPLLRDFAVYFPRPLTDKDNQMLIERRSRSILAGLSVFFKPRLKTEDVWKISIFLNGNKPQNHLQTFGGILNYVVPFDEQEFLSLSIEDQKRYMLNFIIKHLCIVFREMGLGADRLDGFETFITKRDFKNTFKGSVSKYNGLNARMVVSQGFEKAEVSLEIKKGRKEIGHHILIETAASEFAFSKYLNAPIWISENKIKVHGIKDKSFIVNL